MSFWVGNKVSYDISGRRKQLVNSGIKFLSLKLSVPLEYSAKRTKNLKLY